MTGTTETSDSTDPAPADEFGTFVEPGVYLTDDVPGTGGRLRERPEDFLVEEIPAYEPCGSGEHIYLFVEKRNFTTVSMLGVIARHFGVRRSDVGYAGLKDRVAVTRQLVSVHAPGRKPADYPALDHLRVSILWSDLHSNKLRLGHLAGNRFMVRIRAVDPARAVLAHRTLKRLHTLGVPNRAGEQRFGYLVTNHLIGRALILGDFKQALDSLLGPSTRMPHVQTEARTAYAEGRYLDAMDAFPRAAEAERRALRALLRGERPERAIQAIDPMQRGYFVTAFQSAVFNAVLDQRLRLDRGGGVGSLRVGDLAWKHDNGAVFAVDEEVVANPDTRRRLDALEISPSGPMWGLDMMRASGETDAAEVAALEASGVSLARLDEYAKRVRDPIPGKRRPLRVPLRFPDVEGGMDEHGSYVKCVFELPPGSFATVVLREIMKPERTNQMMKDER